MKSCGQTIKDLRRSRGWPQRKLAHELDVDVAVLSRIENENRFPKKRALDIIKAVSDAFNTDELELRKSYLSDEIASILEYETHYGKILQASEEKVSYVRLMNNQIKGDGSN